MGASSPQNLPLNAAETALSMLAGSDRCVVLDVRDEDESMLPILEPGRRVLVRLSTDEPERGEILLFRQADYLVVHRYLGPVTGPDGRPCLRTRGDYRPRLDPPLERSRFLGRVLAIEGRDGTWWDLLGGGARFYALALALHDLFWAAAIALAAGLDERLRLGGKLTSWVVRGDRGGVRATHRLLFRLCHAPLAGAPAAGSNDAAAANGSS